MTNVSAEGLGLITTYLRIKYDQVSMTKVHWSGHESVITMIWKVLYAQVV